MFNSSPVHNDLQLGNTSTTYSTFYSPYVSSFMGYTDLQLGNTSTTYSTFKLAGYQYLLGYIIHQFSDVVSISDTLTQEILLTFEEVVPIKDYLNNGYAIFDDPVAIADDILSNVTIYFEDVVSINDELVSLKSFDEVVAIYDELLVMSVKNFEEPVAITDSFEPFMYGDDYDSVLVSIMQQVQVEDTCIIGVSSVIQQDDSINLGIIQYSLPSTTNASSVSNQFAPTIILDGVIYTYNAITAPSSYGPETRDIFIDNIALGGINLCDVYDYNINLNGSGGTWEIFANAPVGALNATVTICGFAGTVTRIRTEFTNSTFGYRTSGIFGNPQMARPLNMIGDPLLFQLLTNPRTGIKSAEFFSTYAGAAQSIARVVGSSVFWYIADFPYIETFSQEGTSVMDALNSVVTTVGGSLRWNGDNGYSAVYPTQTIGSFSIPSWKLISAANGEQIYDISTGTAGVGSFGFQVYTNNIALGRGLPTESVPSTEFNIQPVYSTSKAMTTLDPPVPIKVSPDSVEAYVQILVKDNYAGTAAYLTSNENEWFSLGSPAITNPYFKPSYGLGEQYQLNLYCGQGLFPANSTPINNGNFILRMGVRKYDPRAEFFAAKDLRDAQVKNQIARTVGQMRYVRNYVANFSCQFFGAIPLPGMLLQDVSLCGTNTIAGGVIENVSLVSPGILNIQAAQYAKIDFHANLAGYSIQTPIPG